MKPTETKAIYEAACRSKRMETKQDEADLWRRVLGGFEARDVRDAVDAWFSDSTPVTIGNSSRPRGAFMPAPAELKPLIDKARRDREARAREPQDYICWQCTNGHRVSGFIARSKPTPESHAPCGYAACGQPMRVFGRDAA